MQAIIVGLTAALFSITVGAAINADFEAVHALLLIGASVATASIASFLLGYACHDLWHV